MCSHGAGTVHLTHAAVTNIRASINVSRKRIANNSRLACAPNVQGTNSLIALAIYLSNHAMSDCCANSDNVCALCSRVRHTAAVEFYCFCYGMLLPKPHLRMTRKSMSVCVCNAHSIEQGREHFSLFRGKSSDTLRSSVVY